MSVHLRMSCETSQTCPSIVLSVFFMDKPHHVVVCVDHPVFLQLRTLTVKVLFHGSRLYAAVYPHFHKAIPPIIA